MAARNLSNTTESVLCKVCNLMVDCKVYNFHIGGKKHKKNVWKQKQLSKNFVATRVPQFVCEEPASLEIQFRSLLNQVLLSQEECLRTSSRILHDLEPCLIREFGRCCPYVFGSMATGLALVGSDVDIYLDTGVYEYLITLPDPKPELQRIVSRCARALRTDWTFTQIVPICHARVPIVKFVHKSTGMSCDISFKDSLGVHNSRLLRFYLFLNPRFFEVMVAIKFWAKKYGLCKTDAISSYGWTLLFVSFLQTLKLPNGNRLVPSVSELQEQCLPDPLSVVNGWRVDFYPYQNFVNLPNEPQFSYFGLTKGFFEYYKNFNFGENIVCPFLGHPAPWSSVVGDDPLPPRYQWFQNHLKTYLNVKGSVRHCISILDPFQHDFLLGGSCSGKKYERILFCFDAATRICCSEEMLADPYTSTFLTNLFTIKIEDHQEKVVFRLRNPQTFPKQYVELALETLEDIFTKIMKFEIKTELNELRPKGEPETKILKKTETQDVHQSNDAIPPFRKKYFCVAFHPVWCFRKKSRREVKLSFPETAFEFETKLSDVIVNHNYPSERIEFSCEVKLMRSVFLELTLNNLDVENSKLRSKEIFQFLKNNLQVWMDNFLSEKLSVSASLLAFQSEPCSSKDGLSVAEREDSENGDVAHSGSESVIPFEDSNSSIEAVDQYQREKGDQTVEDS